jgi:ADP-ribosylglycohydrolase
MVSDFLLGLAIGDAFGAGIEFQDRYWIRENVDFTRFVNARHAIKVADEKKRAFTENYSPWDYTDDTEMTIGLIKALMSGEPFAEDILVKYWHAEYEKGCLEKGFGRNGHGSMAWFYSGQMSISAIRDFQRHRPNPGNAPAMRAAPLGYLPHTLINDYAAINAQATHPNEQAIISSQCVARAAEFMMVKKGNPTQLIPYCLDHIPMNTDYKNSLHAADLLPKYEQLMPSDFEILCGHQPIQEPYFLPGILGLPSDSKYTAISVLYILKHCKNGFDALKKSIYLGGDVDSVASVTTGIIAGRMGIAEIPEFMQESVENMGYIKHISSIFDKWLTQ